MTITPQQKAAIDKLHAAFIEVLREDVGFGATLGLLADFSKEFARKERTNDPSWVGDTHRFEAAILDEAFFN